MTDQAHDDGDMLAATPGSTFTLHDGGGWEASDYLAPEDDWTLLPDGSYESPDGLTRTWLLAEPQPD